MIDIHDIRCRYRQAAKWLDERGRRLFAANEAMAQGYGGATAGLRRHRWQLGSPVARSMTASESFGLGAMTLAGGSAEPAAVARARWRISPGCQRRWRR